MTPVQCDTCGGKGHCGRSNTCEDCAGSGIDSKFGGECSGCIGKGVIYEACPTCTGYGEVDRPDSSSVPEQGIGADFIDLTLGPCNTEDIAKFLRTYFEEGKTDDQT